MGDEGVKEDGARGWGWYNWIDVGRADRTWEIVISSDGGGQGQVGLGRAVRDVGVGPGHMHKAAERGRPGAGMGRWDGVGSCWVEAGLKVGGWGWGARRRGRAECVRSGLTQSF